MWLTVALIALVVQALLLVFPAVGWARIYRRRWALPPQAEAATVIVCLHNEAPTPATADVLTIRLQRLLAQPYPGELHFLFVDDRSQDGTAAVLDLLKAADKRVTIVRIEATPLGYAPKKWALTQALPVAPTDLLAFTDADCTPAPHWLEHLFAPLHHGKTIALGISPYEHRKGLVNLLVQHETLQTAFLYGGWAGLGRPYMGVGRSLAWRKSAIGAAPYRDHQQVLSGDDDLFLQQHATGRNTAVVHGAVTTSAAPHKWQQWFRQKTRHQSAGKAYRPWVIGLLALWAASHLGVYVALPVAATLGQIPMNMSPTGAALILLLAAFATMRAIIMHLVSPKALHLPMRWLGGAFVSDFLLAVSTAALPLLTLLARPQWTNRPSPPPAPKRTNASSKTP